MSTVSMYHASRSKPAQARWIRANTIREMNAKTTPEVLGWDAAARSICQNPFPPFGKSTLTLLRMALRISRRARNRRERVS